MKKERIRKWISAILAGVLCVTGANMGLTIHAQAASKKGLQVGAYSEAIDNHTENAFINLDLSYIITEKNTGKKLFKVGKKQYYLDDTFLLAHLRTFEACRPKNGQLMVKILMSKPLKGISYSKNSGHSAYYALDTKDYYDNVKTVFSVLAKYWGSHVKYWSIGNEIDAFQHYNYMGMISDEKYATYYAKGMYALNKRVKAVNPKAVVLMTFDQGWNYSSADHYNTKRLISLIQKKIKSYGDFDWGIGIQPYADPLTDPAFWDDPGTVVSNSENTVLVTMKNIHVVTNYFKKKALRYKGKVRPICVTEYGVNAFHQDQYDETAQAAAFVYSYYKIADNPYIDMLYYNKQEGAPYYFGFLGRQMQDVFFYIDSKDGNGYSNPYKKYFGIQYWDQLISCTALGYSKTFTGYAKVGDRYVYYKKGKRDTAHDGLYKNGKTGVYEYYSNGRQHLTKKGLILYKGKKVANLRYVKKGVYNKTFKGMCKYNNTYYYVQSGRVNTSYTSLVRMGGVYKYVKNGKLNSTYTGLVKRIENGNVYYVKNGVLQSDYEGLIKSGTKYYYVHNGKRNLSFTGIVLKKENNTEYYVENGVWNKNKNGIVVYNGKEYYVVSGRVVPFPEEPGESSETTEMERVSKEKHTDTSVSTEELTLESVSEEASSMETEESTIQTESSTETLEETSISQEESSESEGSIPESSEVTKESTSEYLETTENMNQERETL